MELTESTIELYVGGCIGSFAIGWAIATAFKFFKQMGEKI